MKGQIVKTDTELSGDSDLEVEDEDQNVSPEESASLLSRIFVV